MAKDLDITRLLDSKIKDLNDFERLKVALASLLVSGPKHSKGYLIVARTLLKLKAKAAKNAISLSSLIISLL